MTTDKHHDNHEKKSSDSGDDIFSKSRYGSRDGTGNRATMTMLEFAHKFGFNR